MPRRLPSPCQDLVPCLFKLRVARPRRRLDSSRRRNALVIGTWPFSFCPLPPPGIFPARHPSIRPPPSPLPLVQAPFSSTTPPGFPSLSFRLGPHPSIASSNVPLTPRATQTHFLPLCTLFPPSAWYCCVVLPNRFLRKQHIRSLSRFRRSFIRLRPGVAYDTKPTCRRHQPTRRLQNQTAIPVIPPFDQPSEPRAALPTRPPLAPPRQ